MNQRFCLFFAASLSFSLAACTPRPETVIHVVVDQLKRTAVHQGTVIGRATIPDRVAQQYG